MADTHEKDEMRLCPTCRMPISILATRCRHCSEEVGRPRKEEHKLTLKDLGGEASTSYTVSGNVMDALDAFREEQLSAQESERRQREASAGTWFGRKGAEPGAHAARTDDMPELDAVSRDLAGIAGLGTSGSGASARPKPRRNLGPTLQDRLIQGGMVLGGLLVLYFVVTFGWGKYQEHLAMQEALANPIYESKALTMLEQGRPIIEVLSEAVDAVRATDSPENREALATVRERALAEIGGLLNSLVYSRETLDQASMLATHAALKDTDPRFQELDRQVKAELDAYSFILQSLDVKTQRANFRIHDTSFGQDEQDVGVNDYVAGRFVVQSILQNQVRLVDTKRKSATGQRLIIARPQEPVTGG